MNFGSGSSSPSSRRKSAVAPGWGYGWHLESSRGTAERSGCDPQPRQRSMERSFGSGSPERQRITELLAATMNGLGRQIDCHGGGAPRSLPLADPNLAAAPAHLGRCFRIVWARPVDQTVNYSGQKSGSGPSRYPGDPTAAHVLKSGLGLTSGWPTNLQSSRSASNRNADRFYEPKEERR